MSDVPQSGADLLARIKPRAKEVHTGLCMRPDLIEAHQAAVEELAQARVDDTGAGRMVDGGVSAKTKKLAQKVKDIEAEIVENEIMFKMRAMSQARWRALCDNHPPRKGNEVDFMAGYNRDAVTDAGVRECLFDPVFDDASWAEFMAVVNPSEWAELRECFTLANQAVVDAPKSALASQILEKRGRGSRPPRASE